MTAKNSKTTPEPEGQLDEELELRAYIQTLGSPNVKCKIERETLAGTWEYVSLVGGGQVNEELIRTKFGSGRYRCTFTGENSKWVGRRIVEIGEINPNIDPTAETDQATSANQIGIAELFAMMRAGEERTHALILEMIKSRNGGDSQKAPDVAGMMNGLVSAVRELKEATEPEKKNSLTETISEAKGLVELLGAGSNGGPDNAYTLVKEALTSIGPPLMEVIKNAGQNPAVSARLTPRTPLPENGDGTAATANPPAADAYQETMNNQADWLRAQIDYLKQKAGYGKKPEDLADWILDNQEEAGCAAIYDAIERGATWEHLIALDPEIDANPKFNNWFRRLFEELRAAIVQVDSSGAGGDPADVGGDEGRGDTGQPEPGSAAPISLT